MRNFTLILCISFPLFLSAQILEPLDDGMTKEAYMLLVLSTAFEEASNERVLRYSDNDEGVDEKTWKTSDSFGNQLIRIQSKQLRGSCSVSSKNDLFYELKMGA